MRINYYIFCVICSFFLISCNNDEVNEENSIPFESELQSGSGVINYAYNTNSFNKNLAVYYHIPQNLTSSTPMVIIFHGTERNAIDYRNTIVNQCEQYGFIAIVPEFSEQNFPGGDGYNLGNVYVDGDNPSINTLNPENEWTFSILEPLFDFFKNKTSNTSTSYHIYGHSAGGQFAHRFLMFKPNARVNKSVVSAGGWYTVPNTNVNFPYGISQSVLETMSMPAFLNKKIFVQVGINDDDPNAAGLRHNSFADAQGLHRKERATYYYNFCQQYATTNNLSFNWSFHLVPNADHDYVKASINAAYLLFN
ncbi:conserved hypothetical protein [Flavobacterium sp. 9AF]|uniref:hypothetical protein n=1 Tax=Flavobacterium sp. 9AF TaxID=2653142 RepID=UPI0012F0C42E|nr:hypothetical protein [Flavobacterium sp. 9AF]VXB05379.1 conserved hypothetical protein [Flavobacterium sp. 9AF]